MFVYVVNATQIFVSSEDNVKYEVGGVSGVHQPTDPLAPTPTNQQPTQQQQQKPCKKRFLNLANVILFH